MLLLSRNPFPEFVDDPGPDARGLPPGLRVQEWKDQCIPTITGQVTRSVWWDARHLLARRRNLYVPRPISRRDACRLNTAAQFPDWILERNSSITVIARLNPDGSVGDLIEGWTGRFYDCPEFPWWIDQVPWICTTTDLITTTGSSQTFNVPGNWTNTNTCSAIGEGGNGASNAGTGALAGGGGAYATVSNVSLTPGGTASYNLGSGGAGVASQFVNSSTLVADNGRNGSGTGAGGSSSNCTPSTGAFSGGAGGTKGSSTEAGGGGGAAGPDGVGQIGGNGNSGGCGGGGGSDGGSSSAGQNASTSGGGNGGNGNGGTGGGTGGASGSNGTAGTAGTGGGGGGAGAAGGNSGGGATGKASWTATVGGATAGAGGGSGGADSSGADAAGGNYGAGGGGGNSTTGCAGAQGIIVAQYTPGAGPKAIPLLALMGIGSFIKLRDAIQNPTPIHRREIPGRILH